MFSRPRWAPQKPTKKRNCKLSQNRWPKEIHIFSVHVRNLYYAISDVSARSSAASAATASQLFPILVTQSLSTSPSSLQTRVSSVSLLSRSCSFRFHCQHQYTGAHNYSPHSHRHCVVLVVGVGNEGLIRTCFWHWPNFHVSSCTLSFAVRCNSCWGRGCC